MSLVSAQLGTAQLGLAQLGQFQKDAGTGARTASVTMTDGGPALDAFAQVSSGIFTLVAMTDGGPALVAFVQNGNVVPAAGKGQAWRFQTEAGWLFFQELLELQSSVGSDSTPFAGFSGIGGSTETEGA